MSTMIRRDRPKVMAARKTARPDRPFGAGILLSVPYYGRQPFTQADLDWAAQAFGESEPDYDVLAAGSAGFDAVIAGCYA